MTLAQMSEASCNDLLQLTSMLELAPPEQIHDLLLELSRRPELVADPALLLESLGQGLGLNFQRIALRAEELPEQTQNFHLVQPLADGWLLVSRRRGRLSLQLWQQGQMLQRRFSVRLLKRLSADSGSWLAIEANSPQHQPALSPFQRLQEFLRPERRDIWLIVGYSAGMGVLGLGVPLAIQALVNSVAFGILLQPLLVLTGLVMLTLACLSLMRSFRLILVEMLQRRLFIHVTRESARRLVQVQLDAIEHRRLPELVNRFFDVLTLQKSASFLLLDGLGLLLQSLTGMALLAIYHPYLLGFDFLLLLAGLFILVVLGRGAQRTSIQESGQKYAIAAWLEELATHPKLFKHQAGISYAAWKSEALLQRYLDARSGHFRIVLRQNIGAFALQTVASALLLGLGGWLVIRGELTLGQLVAAELIVAGVLDNFAKLGKHLEVWYDLMAALDKLGYLFNLPQERLRHGLLTPGRSPLGIEIVGLNDVHPHHHLEQLDFAMAPGERVAIVGANTWEGHTLLELIYGTRRPGSGLIRVGGQAVQQLLQPLYRSEIALVREVEIIEGSLLDNLRIARRDLSRSEALDLLTDVGIRERVQQLPEGLDTPLSFSGFPLSPGEAHRLMLARALAMRPRLLLIDGLLDQIEWRSEGPLSRKLFSSEQPRELSLLVITGQPELLPAFDRCYVFADGQLAPYTPLAQQTHG